MWGRHNQPVCRGGLDSQCVGGRKLFTEGVDGARCNNAHTHTHTHTHTHITHTLTRTGGIQGPLAAGALASSSHPHTHTHAPGSTLSRSSSQQQQQQQQQHHHHHHQASQDNGSNSRNASQAKYVSLLHADLDNVSQGGCAHYLYHNVSVPAVYTTR